MIAYAYLKSITDIIFGVKEVIGVQCNQIGQFLQVLGSNCLTKVAQICWRLFGLFLI